MISRHLPALLPLLAVTAMAQTPAPATVSAAPASSAALTRLEKSPRHQEWVEIKSGDRTVHTFVVYPEVKDKAMVVVVIHENRGLNDWARAVADRLAENGYIAIAPDLLTGTAPGGGNTKDFPTQNAATEAIGKLPGRAGARRPQRRAPTTARPLPAASGRLAVVGFCWGGGKSWAVAVARHDLALANVFYGTPPADAAAYASVTAPVLGYYGGSDARVDATIEKTVGGMKAAGKTYEPVTYDGAGHAFMRLGEEPDASPANKAAMTAGWERLHTALATAKGWRQV